MKYKNKRIIIVCFCLISLLILSGCFSPGVTYIDYRSGTEGLNINIIGPNDITLYPGSTSEYDEYEFRIINKGSTTINKDDIYMRIQLTNNFLREKDTDKNRIILRSMDDFNAQKTTYLEGKTRFNIQGYDISHFINIEAIPGPHRYTTANIRADLCYRYKTILTESICINTRKHRPNQGCNKKEYYFSNGQGAPIRISKLEVRELQTSDDNIEIRLMITVENVQGNIVSSAQSDKFAEGCLLQQDINKIDIIEAKLGSIDLNCNNNNDIIELIDNQRTITCTIDDNISDNAQGYFDTPLYIELAYGYYTTYSKSISIIRTEY
jgi:hypothetical protein